MTYFRFLVAALLAALIFFPTEARAQEEPAADSAIPLPTEWDTYYVVLLKEGPAYGAKLSTDSLRSLMNRHIQYQLRLQKSGDAVAGGGFGGAKDGVIGMTLLRAASLDEAERLAGADPAVEAGRFSAVVYEWYVPGGRLPE